MTLARRQLVGSARATRDGQSFLLAAARLSVLAEKQPVLVLGLHAPAPTATPAALPPQDVRAAHPLSWALVAAVGLGGVGLLVTGRKPGRATGAATGQITIELPREPTLKLGSRRELPQPPAPLARRRPARACRQAVRALSPPRSPGRRRHGGDLPGRSVGRRGVHAHVRAQALRPELARDKEAVAQFVDEARLQAGLVHSNIVPVFDFGVVDGEYFMTQEYIVGRDLARLMERYHGTALPAPLAYFVAHETLQALAYAHAHHDQEGSALGVVHRDVSPANIMVSNAGEVKLADFGIVKLNSRVSRTQVGMVKGNANFMSPEQARGQAVDARSDLFSLALALYYSLSGELLYSGNNDLEVLYRAAGGLDADDIARIRKLADPAPQILERAMALDPGERFQSATEFADALAIHMGGGRAALTRLMQDLSTADPRRNTA